MPIRSDPNAIARVHLKLDEKLPEDQRPTFLFKFLSRRQRTRIRELWAKRNRATLASEQMATADEILQMGIVGWEHVKRSMFEPGSAYNPAGCDPEEAVPYSWEAVDELLTEEEIEELAGKYPRATDFAEQDLKNSGSPSTSAEGESAVTAATAPIPPASDCPSNTASG